MEETESDRSAHTAHRSSSEGAKKDRDIHARKLRQCTKCGSDGLRRSRHRGNYETFILPLLFRRPYRCRACNTRYYSFDAGQTTVKGIILAIVALGMAVLLTFFVWKIIENFWQSAQAAGATSAALTFRVSAQ
jgi:hypothetical protein